MVRVPLAACVRMFGALAPVFNLFPTASLLFVHRNNILIEMKCINENVQIKSNIKFAAISTAHMRNCGFNQHARLQWTNFYWNVFFPWFSIHLLLRKEERKTLCVETLAVQCMQCLIYCTIGCNHKCDKFMRLQSTVYRPETMSSIFFVRWYRWWRQHIRIIGMNCHKNGANQHIRIIGRKVQNQQKKIRRVMWRAR